MRQKPNSRVRSFSLLTLLASTFAVLGGCSFLYDLDGEQCSTDGDCDKLGGPLAGRQCIDNLCVADTEQQGGSAGSGGGGTGSGGSSGSGATGGTEALPDCETHQDCMDDAEGLPAVCREGTCTTLVNGADDGECTVVLGLENLSATDNRNVFVFGAFSAIPDPQQPRSSPITLNFEYVIDEISDRGGLRIQGETQYPVAVVCNAAGADAASLDKSFDHLVDAVDVPAIISSVYALELKRSFERIYDGGDGKDVFFLSPFESDQVLTKIDDSGLLWHLLPDSLSVAPAYVPLFERVEAKVVDGGVTPPLRVALIESDFQWLLDVSDYLQENLVFNGLSPIENGENFELVKIDSAGEEWVTAYSQLEAFKPHVIISASGTEFHQVMEQLEAEWDTFAGGQARPYYVLSPFQYGVELTDLVSEDPTLGERVVGVNTASAEDLTLYNEYLIDFKATYKGFEQPELLNGTENFYDAALFTLLAASAAGNVPTLTGLDIARGMGRLVDTVDGTDADMTLDKVQEYSQSLNTTESNYALTGTLGPPNFNLGFGTRKGKGSAWCVTSDPVVLFDVLRYDEENSSLTGDFPAACFDLPEP
jgi:hypothetical protein